MKIDLSEIVGRSGFQNAALMGFLAQCFALATCDGYIDAKFGPGVPQIVAKHLNRNLQVAVRQSRHIAVRKNEESTDENPVYVVGFANDGPQFGSLTIDFSHGETTVIAVDLSEV